MSLNAKMNAEGYSAFEVACAVRSAVAAIAAEFEKKGHAGGWRDGQGAVPFASIEDARYYFDNDTAIEVVIHGKMELGFYLHGKQVEYKRFQKHQKGIVLAKEWAQMWEEWDRQEFLEELDWLASGHVPEADAVARVAAFLKVGESRTLIGAVRLELAAMRQKNGY